MGGSAFQFSDLTAWAGLGYYYWLVASNVYGPGDPTDALFGLSEYNPGGGLPHVKLSYSESITELSWLSEGDETYLVLFSNDMKNWHIFPEAVSGTGELIEWAYDDPDSVGYPIFFKVGQVKE